MKGLKVIRVGYVSLSHCTMGNAGVPDALNNRQDLAYDVHILTEDVAKFLFASITVKIDVLEFDTVVYSMIFIIWDVTMLAGFTHCSFVVFPAF